MAASFTLPQQAQITGLLAPAADASGRTGAWITAKYAHKVYIICYINQGNAATILLTPEQAQGGAVGSQVTGTGAKALTGGVRIWYAQNITSGTGTDQFVRQTDAVNFTTDAGVEPKICIFEIQPEDLDLVNGFNALTVVTGASNVANITSALAVVIPARYASDPMQSLFVN